MTNKINLQDRIEEVKKQIREALWMAYCSGRAGNKYIPEEVLPDLLKRCQLFPQPLTDEELGEKAQKLKGMIKDITTSADKREKWAEMFEIIDQLLALLQQRQKPLDDEELREKALLIDEEIRRLRPKPLDCGRCEYSDCKLTELDKARCWARRAANASIDKALALLQPKIEQERERIREGLLLQFAVWTNTQNDRTFVIDIDAWDRFWQSLNGADK